MKNRPILLLLMLLSMLLMPQWASPQDTDSESEANGGWMLDDSTQYRVSAIGSSVHFQIPFYDQVGADSWIQRCNIFVRAEGLPEVKLLYCRSHCLKEVNGNCEGKFNFFGDGSMKVQDAGSSWVSIGSAEKIVMIRHDEINSNYYYAYIQWDPPYEYRSKETLYFRFDVEGCGNGIRDWIVKIPTKSVTGLTPPPDMVQPSILSTMVNIDATHKKKTSVMWQIMAETVTAVKAHYCADGDSVNVDLPAVNPGMFDVPSDKVIKNLNIEVDYKDFEGKERKGSRSVSIDVPYFHQAKDVQTTLNADGSVQIDWMVDNKNLTDIMPLDFWVVERNVKGSAKDNNDNWFTIGQIGFEQGIEKFSYTDNSLLPVYEDSMVTYRVQRASVYSTWGCTYDSGTGYGSMSRKMVLPPVLSPTAERTEDWGQNNKYKALLRWETLPSAPGDGAFCLNSSMDWEELVKMVNQGVCPSKVVMTNDISISIKAPENMLGTMRCPFTGIFDGRGYTLTVNIKNDTLEYVAPFSYVRGATIKDLHVTGTVEGGSYSSGLVGCSVDGGDITIDRCRVSVKVYFHKTSGGYICGGFIGHGHKVNHFISNCLFDGVLQPYASGHSIAGAFIGNGDDISLNKLTNNLDRGQFKDVVYWYFCTAIKGGDYGNNSRNTNNYSIHHLPEMGEGFYNVSTGNPTELALKLGAGWAACNKLCLPIMNNTYSIYGYDDWCVFVNLVSKNPKINARLFADIQLKDGDVVPHIYKGVFDGQGGRIDVNFSRSNGLFAELDSATIKNVYITGDIMPKFVDGSFNAKMLGSLAGQVRSNTTISSCRSSVSFLFSDQGNASVGGFVGGAGNLEMIDCLFDGSFSNVKQTKCSGFVGCSVANDSKPSSLRLTNCYFKTTFVLNTDGVESYTFANFENLTLTNCYYSEPFGKEQGIDASDMEIAELQKALGKSWILSGNEVVPIQWEPIVAVPTTTNVWDPNASLKLYIDQYVHGKLTYTNERPITDSEREAKKMEVELPKSCVDYGFRFVLDATQSALCIGGKEKSVRIDTLTIAPQHSTPEKLSPFYYDANAKLDSLQVTQLHSSIKLQWWTNGGNVDYYEIVRHSDSGLDAEEDSVIATNLQQTAYIDKDVKAFHLYNYKVKAVVQCEGLHVDTLMAWNKQCDWFGRVSGYVRMANGTGIGGVKVRATSLDSIPGGPYEAITDSTGYYMLDSLRYAPGNGRFSIVVPIQDSGYSSYECNFTEGKNDFPGTILIQEKYFVFSGTVLYEGTSIPVPGVQFRLDGNPIYDHRQQRLETDNQGSFTLNIPAGSHRVQMEKEGHVFANNGYYKDPETRKDTINWQRNRAGVFLWDKTRVRLRGRIIGGDVQGSLPLGQSLSHNNLGRDLKIVMQLEGDNTSWIVRDPQNLDITERHESLSHGKDNKDTTFVDMTRHSITVHPDEKTGEYEMTIFPAKYKVTELSCIGYSTLFQEGKVGEIIDLTHEKHDSIYDCRFIYHSGVKLGVNQLKQMFMSDEDYFGEKFYLSLGTDNKADTVAIWTAPTDSTAGGYTLGHPVFMTGNPYVLMLQAKEEYAFENRTDTVPDIVPLREGTVYFKNDFVGLNVTDSVRLDSLGRGSYLFTPLNTTFVGNDENALRKLDINLLYNGVYYDVKPLNGDLLRGYVMGSIPSPQGTEILAKGPTHLVDILRDPPGANSFAYIEKGSTHDYSYSFKLDGSIVLKTDFSQGKFGETYTGVFAGAGSGSVTLAKSGTYQTSNKGSFNFGIKGSYGYVRSYSITTNEKITTSSNPKWIGPDADVYIGITEDVAIAKAIAVRMVSERQFNLLKNRLGGTVLIGGGKFDIKDGAMKVIASGVNVAGEPVYLISDEVTKISPKFKSTFMHTGYHIENELIPNLLKRRNELLLPKGTDSLYAQGLADKKKENVYISLVEPDDPQYGLHAFLTTDNKNKYKIIRPKDMPNLADSIQGANNDVLTWFRFLIKNEEERVLAPYLCDSVLTYDFDGLTNVSYSETYTANAQYSRNLLPTNISGGLGMIPGIPASKEVTEKIKEYLADKEKKSEKTYELNTFGTNFTIKITPVLEVNLSDANTQGDSWKKTTGFTLSTTPKSNLNVSVYRLIPNRSKIEEDVKNGNCDVFMKISQETINAIHDHHALTYIDKLEQMYGNYVYRTNGGATCGPWEDERATKYFNPGTVFDQKTVQIDQLRIWADQSIVSNVPYGDPARFTIYLCNESPKPSLATMVFTLSVPDASNQHGARIMYGGNALSASGYTVVIPPGEVIAKEIEVYAGEDFDYEDLAIQLFDPNDLKRKCSVKLTAHFVPSAGKINISTPGDKWVVNTESPYDKKERGYYMPVRIDGFNVNQRSFDHIELQYKLSTQGEKDWVNICSFYKSDSLMSLVSGNCKLIENDAYIMTRFFGEKDPVEQYYDLRAVVYCRNASGFVTASSPILTGVKDTRRPTIFGTPKPVDGILGIGDDINITFSEPIASNYLSAVNNFEVLGYANSSNITQGNCLRFNGGQGSEMMASRNLAGKSFTLDVMIEPDKHDKDMCVFYHGDKDEYLLAGLTKDNRLMAYINGQYIMSKDSIAFNGLQQVSYVFKADPAQKRTHVKFYAGSKELNTQQIYNGIYKGTGTMKLGEKPSENEAPALQNIDNYHGTMLEMRIWNRALSIGDINRFARKRLTGYELGLLDNYYLNEGRGKFSINHGPGGGELLLNAATWKTHKGISAKLDGEKGFALKDSAFVRTNTQDYTLMFWFRADKSSGTLLANGTAKLDNGVTDQINIGLTNDNLYFRSDSFQVETTDRILSDGAWHHMAVTVNRARNVGNLYVDMDLVESFPADTLGGIMDYGRMTAGATRVSETQYVEPLSGNIDEIALYEMALPGDVIRSYASSTPSGREMGTMVYLPFSKMVKLASNEQRMDPSGESIKSSRDNQGVYSTRKDVIVADRIMQAIADRVNYAPIDNAGERENMKFSYVADRQNLLINVDEPAANLEKTHLYITVRSVTDLNGNYMESPLMMDLYVYRNPLRWSTKSLYLEAAYGEGTTTEVTIRNLSGKRQKYYLQELPLWITPSKTEGTIDADGEETILLTLSPYVNIGNYVEILNLVNEDGMNEPLPIYYSVRGTSPDWTVSDALKQKNLTMGIVARVMINGVVASDPDDIIGVFGNNHKTLGVAHPSVDYTGNVNESLAYITVYNINTSAQPLHFEYYEAATGNIYMLTDQGLCFKPDTIIGTSKDPIILENTNMMVQTLDVKKGWNWLSLYVEPQSDTVSNLLGRATQWEVGDAWEYEYKGTFRQLTYKAVKDKKNPTRLNYFWDYGDSQAIVDAKKMYRFFSMNDKVAYISGLKGSSDITVQHGWNRIAFISQINLPVANALADYTSKASIGDIIKSQSQFAVLTEDAYHNRLWKGTLTHLVTGQGYMLKHLGQDSVSFYYPDYFYEVIYDKNEDESGQTTVQAPAFDNRTGNSMNIIARTLGVEVEEGDCLVVYNGSEMCGKSELSADSLFYLSIGESGTSRLSFALERDGELIAVTGERMAYQTNAVLGTVSQPTVIDFTTIDRYADGEWYDIQGRKLDKRPERKGIYIYNGQKTILR